jgi:hypothetical protein
MRFNMSSITSPSLASSMDGLFGSEGVGSTTQPDFAALFSSYLDDDGESEGESQSTTAGPLSSAQDNDILQQITAGDSKLGAKFEQDMKSGNKKGILNDIQNALHEGLISKDAASQFMQQPDMEKMFKGTHMATKKGYEDVVNEDDTRGFDGGKGGSALLKAGDKYDAEQVLKYLLPFLALPLLAIPGLGEAVLGAEVVGTAVDVGVGAAVAGGEAAADAAGIGSTVGSIAGTVSDFAGGASDFADGVGSAVSDAISPATDAADAALESGADFFGTTPQDLEDTISQAADNSNDAANFAQQQEQNIAQDRSNNQQQAALQQFLQEQAAIGA